MDLTMLPTILEFCEQIAKGSNFTTKNYSELIFKTKQELSSFNRFLFDSRIIPFFLLKILATENCLEDTFFIGTRQNTFFEYEGDDPYDESARVHQKKELGLGLYKHQFSGAEVWDGLLEKLAIAQISTPNNILLDALKSTFEERVPENTTYTAAIDRQEIFYVNRTKKFFFSNEEIIAEKPFIEKMEKLFLSHMQEWKEFLSQEHGSVDHGFYVVWLQKAFPGKVHIRALS